MTLRAHILDLLQQLILLPTLFVLVIVAATAAAWVALLAERGKPARLGRKELGTLSREAGARVVFGLGTLLLRGDGQPELGVGSPDRVPVLLIPGAPQGRVALGPLARFLRQRGWGQTWAVGSGRGPLAQRAEAVAQHVERLRRATGASQVDLVGHGLGGLAAAWYVRHLDDQHVVRRLVTLGTPWHGTRMAVFTRAPLGTETLPGAPLLDGLAPPPVPTVCVWGSLDPMVLPASSAVAEGAVSVKLSGAGHLDMLLSARAYRAVQDALTQPDPGAPT